MLYRLFQIIISTAIAALLTTCATTTNVDYDEKYDFSSIHSIKIVDPKLQATGDTRLDNPLMINRIRDAIKNTLRIRGYTLVSDNGDINLVYQLSKRSGVESASSGITFGYGTFGSHGGIGMAYGYPGYDVQSYDEGVLTIDMINAKDNFLVWRGSSSRRLYNGNTPKKSKKVVNALVAEILSRFPPRTGK